MSKSGVKFVLLDSMSNKPMDLKSLMVCKFSKTVLNSVYVFVVTGG